ncbi:MAG: TonB-dependent receptor [Pseudomonadota bacterium]
MSTYVITLRFLAQGPSRCSAALVTLLLAVGSVAFAAENQPQKENEDEPPEVEEIVVYGHTIPAGPQLSPATTLSGDDLARRVGSTLGATLDEELGVHNASFGPGVGIPVIRGLTGSRVKMLQNGIGTHDASAASPDHAVAVEPILAEQIRIVRGADVVRYGSGAAGGAVEIIDGRIPREAPGRYLSGTVESRYGNNPEGHLAAFKVDMGYDYLTLHVDGFDRQTGNVDIPGAALDEDAVRQQFGEFVEFERSEGRLRNSDAEARGGAVGASIAGDHGFLGAAISTMSNEYGIPPGGLPPHSDIPGQAPTEQRIRIDLDQSRREMQAEWQPASFIDKISGQVAHVDYRHHESDNSRVSTTFRNEVIEGRGEIDLWWSDWATTSIGSQLVDRQFGATGFETFVPESDIDTLGVYVVQKFDFSKWGAEFGFRRESVTTRPSETQRSIGGIVSIDLPDELDYVAYSGSFVLNVDLTQTLSAHASYSYTQRAPDVQELLSLGPHLSTRSFDIGNVELDLETTQSKEFGLVWETGIATLESDFYYRDISDFIYQENLGFLFDVEEQLFKAECVQIDQCVSAFGYLQQDAKFLGFETRATVPFETRVGLFSVSAFAELVRGYFVDPGAGSVPRLPPLSYGTAIEYEKLGWYGKVRLSHSTAQNRAGLNETLTPSYMALSAEASYRFKAPFGRNGFAFVRARNLLNDDIRNSTSFLRQFMPEPGRAVDVGLRFDF